MFLLQPCVLILNLGTILESLQHLEGGRQTLQGFAVAAVTFVISHLDLGCVAGWECEGRFPTSPRHPAACATLRALCLEVSG